MSVGARGAGELAIIWIAALAMLEASPAAGGTFFPSALGTVWEYRQQGGLPEEYTVRIAAKEALGEVETLRMETTAQGAVIRTQFITVDEDGVHLHGQTKPDGSIATFVPPRKLLPAPLTVGTSWELEDEVPGMPVTQRFNVAASERVRVPAGVFRTFRLHMEEPWPVAVTVERWFAPGTGLVREVTTTRGPGGRLVSRLVAVLIRFVPGEQAAAPATPPPAPSLAPTVMGPPQFRVVISKERDGGPATRFTSDVPEIFVEWKGQNLPLDSTVRVVWIAEDVGEVAEPNFVVDRRDIEVRDPEMGARFTLGRPLDGWAPGRYRFELYLDDVLMEKVDVSIAD